MRNAVVGLLAGVLVVAVLLFALGAGDVFAVVRAADAAVVLASLVVGTASVVVRGEAFRQLRRQLVRTPYGGWFYAAYYSAHFVKLTLPVGAASFPAILAYVMSREDDTAFEQDLAVATAANLLGYTTSFLLAFVGLGLFLSTGDGLANGPLLAAAVGIGVVLVVALATLAVLVYWPAVVDAVVHRWAKLVRRTVGRLSGRIRGAVERDAVAERLARFHETIELLRDARRGVAAVAVLTAVSWVLMALPLWLSFLAVGAWVPFAVVLFAVPTANVAGVLPIPGGLGGVELALGTVVLAAATVSVQVVAAAVLLHRLATYWTPLFVGGLSSLLVSIDARRIQS